MNNTIIIPKATIQKFVITYLENYPNHEYSVNLKLVDNKLKTSGKIVIGSKELVATPDQSKETTGNIHSHNESYFADFPFDKGYSDIDLFYFIQDILRDDRIMPLPHYCLTISPLKQIQFPTIEIVCEVYKDINEKMLLENKIGAGFIIYDSKGKIIADCINKTSIESLKNGNFVGSNMIQKQTAHNMLANIKRYLLKNNLLKQYNILLKPIKNNGEITYKCKDWQMEMIT